MNTDSSGNLSTWWKVAAFVDVTIVGIAIGAVGGVMFDGLFASIVITAIAGAASAAASDGITDLDVKMSGGIYVSAHE